MHDGPTLTRGHSRRPRRVLVVEISEDGTVGGSHRCLFDLVRGLDRASYTPVVLFYQHNVYVERLRALGIEVYAWDEARRAETAYRLWRRPLRRLRAWWNVPVAIARRMQFLRRQRIDLVHLNNSPSVGFSDWLPAARLLGVACVAHARAEYAKPRTPLGRWLTRRYDRVIAISEHIADNLRSAGIPSTRIVRIYDGIDLTQWDLDPQIDPSETRRALGLPEAAMLIAMVAHVRWWKGHDVVLAALSHLAPDMRGRLHVVFVGGFPQSDASYQEGLARTVREGGLKTCATFLGPRDDVRSVMHAADVVLHASTIPEPLGLVVLEGMAAGKAVVASKLGGPGETVTPTSGILFDPSQPAELSALLAELLDCPDRRRALGSAAKRRAREFDVSRTNEAIQRVYADALRRPA